MKGFLGTLVVVSAVIAGLWFAYEPFLKPLFEKSTGMAESGETLLPGEGVPAPRPADGEAVPPANGDAAPAATTSPSTAVSKAEAPAASAPPKTELDRLVEERYPMPEILPLEEIVGHWRQVPPNAFPEEVVSRESIAFELVVDGQVIGSSNVAPGTPLKPLRLDGDRLTLANAANPSMNTVIPVDQTDFKERIGARYQAFVDKVRSDVEARRAQAKAAVEADPSRMALLTGQALPAAAQADGGSDPRFLPVKQSLRNGEVASVTYDEARHYVWNGSETIRGSLAGTYDTVTVHFEVATIFGKFPVELKCLLSGGRVAGWVDPITLEKL